MPRPHLNHRARPADASQAKTAAAPLGAPPGARPAPSQPRPDAVAAEVWPAVTAPELAAALTEIDARRITGNAGTVTLFLAVGPGAQHYVVEIESAGGECVASISADTRSEALDAYLHPFARPDVPDIFSEAGM